MRLSAPSVYHPALPASEKLTKDEAAELCSVQFPGRNGRAFERAWAALGKERKFRRGEHGKKIGGRGRNLAPVKGSALFHIERCCESWLGVAAFQYDFVAVEFSIDAHTVFAVGADPLVRRRGKAVVESLPYEMHFVLPHGSRLHSCTPSRKGLLKIRNTGCGRRKQRHARNSYQSRFHKNALL